MSRSIVLAWGLVHWSVSIYPIAIPPPPHTHTHADCDDDGEDAAGGKLAELLTFMKVNSECYWIAKSSSHVPSKAVLTRLVCITHAHNNIDVVVVVSRWFGGVLLGPSRFRIINNTARQLLERVCGDAGQGDAGGSGKGGASGKKGGAGGSSKR